MSKAYQAIERFSEDVDVTYDIHTIAPDLVSAADDGLPPSRSQADRWSKAIRGRLERWVADEALSTVRKHLQNDRMTARVSAQKNKVTISYEPHEEGTGYVRPEVVLEFGARSTGEPSETRSVTCDVATYLPEVSFPKAAPKVMRPERTFWEKATAIHVYCKGGGFRNADRFSRHWYDIVSLDTTGFVDSAVTNRLLAAYVARHKSFFFREHDGHGEVIDYEQVVSGGLLLVPTGAARDQLALDYEGMVDDGLVLEQAPEFGALVAHCRVIQDRANNAAS